MRPLSHRTMPFAVAGLCLAAALLGGCTEDTMRPPAPNAAPDTRLVSYSSGPGAVEFQVRFAWTGTDPDGWISGYEWKLCPIGTDGIDPADTATVDAATGEPLHPWQRSDGTEERLIARADLPDFPDDLHLPPEERRGWQASVFLVRSIDNRGKRDPTPALAAFTATTLLPTIVVDRPPVQVSPLLLAERMPSSPRFGWTGVDPDLASG